MLLNKHRGMRGWRRHENHPPREPSKNSFGRSPTRSLARLARWFALVMPAAPPAGMFRGRDLFGTSMQARVAANDEAAAGKGSGPAAGGGRVSRFGAAMS